MSTSLLDILRKRLLESIRSVNPPDRWKVLVIDEHSQRILNSVLKTYDVLEENVSLIESISSRRPPQPQTEAMYLLMPTTANVNRIIADFSGNQPQYAGAHVFFIDGLAEGLFERLASSPAEPYLRQLVDLYLNYAVSESRVFDIRSPEMFYSFLSPPRDPGKLTARLQRLDNELRFCSKILLNLCVSLNEFPLIRYYQPIHHGPLGPLSLLPQDSAAAPPTPSSGHAAPIGSSRYYSSEAAAPPSEGGLRWARAAALRATEAASSSSLSLLTSANSPSLIPAGDGLAKKLATMLQAELDDYRKGNPDFPKTEQGRPRGTVIITDRTLDTFAPFLHEFTYQAMANDLLPIEDGRLYTYKFASATAPGGYEERTATLSDSDQLWCTVRHLHMKDAIDKLMADFNKFLEENAGFRAGDGATSLNDMKDMLAGLPQYQEMREKFSLHLTMAQQCMDLFEKKKLMLTGNVQQICATGVTPDNKAPKKIVEDMVPLLDTREVSSRDKVRIIALYVMFRDGVPEEDQRRLFQHARLSLAEQDAVKNLVRLGVRMNRASGDRDTKKLKFKSSTKDSEEEEYELSRYKPVIHHVLSEHISGRLDTSAFPYVRDGPTSFQASLTATPAAQTSVASRLTSSARGAKVFGGGGGGAGTPVSSAPSSLRSTKRAANVAGGGRPGLLDSGAGSYVGGSSRGGGNEKEPVRQRVILFMAGGMTYSEMRTAYQVGARMGKDVYIGSTHAITPEGFIDDLKALEMEGVGSAALPNGIPPGGPEAGRYQDYYDKRYYTPDPPPPAAAAPAPSKHANGGRSANNNGGGGLRPQAAPTATSSPTPSHASTVSSSGKKEKKHRWGW